VTLLFVVVLSRMHVDFLQDIIIVPQVN